MAMAAPGSAEWASLRHTVEVGWWILTGSRGNCRLAHSDLLGLDNLATEVHMFQHRMPRGGDAPALVDEVDLKPGVEARVPPAIFRIAVEDERGDRLLSGKAYRSLVFDGEDDVPADRLAGIGLCRLRQFPEPDRRR